jgi:hypothetical protein
MEFLRFASDRLPLLFVPDDPSGIFRSTFRLPPDKFGSRLRDGIRSRHHVALAAPGSTEMY